MEKWKWNERMGFLFYSSLAIFIYWLKFLQKMVAKNEKIFSFLFLANVNYDARLREGRGKLYLPMANWIYFIYIQKWHQKKGRNIEGMINLEQIKIKFTFQFNLIFIFGHLIHFILANYFQLGRRSSFPFPLFCPFPSFFTEFSAISVDQFRSNFAPIPGQFPTNSTGMRIVEANR
jgi:hypothetical protein